MPHCLIKYTLHKYKVLWLFQQKKGRGVTGYKSIKIWWARNVDVFHFGEEG